MSEQVVTNLPRTQHLASPEKSQSLSPNQESKVLLASLEKLNFSYGFYLTPGKFHQEQTARNHLTFLKSEMVQGEKRLEELARDYPLIVDLPAIEKRFQVAKQNGISSWGEFSEKLKEEQRIKAVEQNNNQSQLETIWKNALLACGHTVEAADNIFIGGAKTLFASAIRLENPFEVAKDVGAKHILENQKYYNTQWGSVFGTNSEFAAMTTYEAMMATNYVCHFGSAVISPLISTTNLAYDFYCMKVIGGDLNYHEFKLLQQQDPLLRWGKNSFHIAEISLSLACIGKLHGATTFSELTAPLKVGSIFGGVGALGNELCAEDGLSYSRFVDNFLEQMSGSLICNMLLGFAASKYSRWKLGKDVPISAEQLQKLKPQELAQVIKVRELAQKSTSALDFADAQNDLKESSVEFFKEVSKHQWDWKSVQEIDWQKGRKILGRSLLTGLSGYDAFDYNGATPNTLSNQPFENSAREQLTAELPLALSASELKKLSLQEKTEYLTKQLNIPNLNILSYAEGLDYCKVELNGIRGELRYSQNGAIFINKSPLLFQEIVRLDLIEKLRRDPHSLELTEEEIKAIAKEKSKIAKSNTDRFGRIITNSIDLEIDSREERIAKASSIHHEYLHQNQINFPTLTPEQKEYLAYAGQDNFVQKATAGNFVLDFSSATIQPANTRWENRNSLINSHLHNSLANNNNTFLALATENITTINQKIAQYNEVIHRWLEEEMEQLRKIPGISTKKLSLLQTRGISTFSTLALLVAELIGIDINQLRSLVVSLELINVAELQTVSSVNAISGTKLLQANLLIFAAFKNILSQNTTFFSNEIANYWTSLFTNACLKRTSAEVRSTTKASKGLLPLKDVNPISNIDTSFLECATLAPLAHLDSTSREQYKPALKAFLGYFEEAISLINHQSAHSLLIEQYLSFLNKLNQAKAALQIFGIKSNMLCDYLDLLKNKIDTIAQRTTKTEKTSTTIPLEKALSPNEQRIIGDINYHCERKNKKKKRFSELISFWNSEQEGIIGSKQVLSYFCYKLKESCYRTIIEQIKDGKTKTIDTGISRATNIAARKALQEIEAAISSNISSSTGHDLLLLICSLELSPGRGSKLSTLKRIPEAIAFANSEELGRVALILTSFNYYDHSLVEAIFERLFSIDPNPTPYILSPFTKLAANFTHKNARLIEIAKHTCKDLKKLAEIKGNTKAQSSLITFLLHLVKLYEEDYVRNIKLSSTDIALQEINTITEYAQIYLATYATWPESIDVSELSDFNSHHNQSVSEEEVFILLKEMFPETNVSIQSGFSNFPYVDDVRMIFNDDQYFPKGTIIVLEYDGNPFHYINSDPKQGLLGASDLKNRIYEKLGIHIARIPDSDWFELKSIKDKKLYLGRKISELRSLIMPVTPAVIDPEIKAADPSPAKSTKEKIPKTKIDQTPLAMLPPVITPEVQSKPPPTPAIAMPRKSAMDVLDIPERRVRVALVEDCSSLEGNFRHQFRAMYPTIKDRTAEDLYVEAQTELRRKEFNQESTNPGSNVFLKYVDGASKILGIVFGKQDTFAGDAVIVYRNYHLDMNQKIEDTLNKGFAAYFWDTFVTADNLCDIPVLVLRITKEATRNHIKTILSAFETLNKHYGTNYAIETNCPNTNLQFSQTTHGDLIIGQIGENFPVYQIEIRVTNNERIGTPFFPNREAFVKPDTTVAEQNKTETTLVAENEQEIEPKPPSTTDEYTTISEDEAAALMTYAVVLEADSNAAQMIPELLKLMNGDASDDEICAKLETITPAERISLFASPEFFEAFNTWVSNLIINKPILEAFAYLSICFEKTEARFFLAEAISKLSSELAITDPEKALLLNESTLQIFSLPDKMKKANFSMLLRGVMLDPNSELAWKKLEAEYPTPEEQVIIFSLIKSHEAVLLFSGKVRESIDLSINSSFRLEKLRSKLQKSFDEMRIRYPDLVKEKDKIKSQVGPNLSDTKINHFKKRLKIMSEFDQQFRALGHLLIRLVETIEIREKANYSNQAHLTILRKFDHVTEYYQVAAENSENIYEGIIDKLLLGEFNFSAEQFDIMYQEAPGKTIGQALCLLMLAGKYHRVQEIRSRLYVNVSDYVASCINAVAYTIQYGKVGNLQTLVKNFSINQSIVNDAYLRVASQYREDKQQSMATRAKYLLDTIPKSSNDSLPTPELSYTTATTEQRKALSLQPQTRNDNDTIDERFFHWLLYPATGVATANIEYDPVVGGPMAIQGKFAFNTSRTLDSLHGPLHALPFLDNLSILPNDIRIFKATTLGGIESMNSTPTVEYLVNQILLSIQDLTSKVLHNDKVDVDDLCYLLFANQILLYLKRAYGVENGIKDDILETGVNNFLAELPPQDKWHPYTAQYFSALRSGPPLSHRTSQNP